MHEPRGKQALALAYATAPAGADHMRAPHDPAYEAFHPRGGHPLEPLGLAEPVWIEDDDVDLDYHVRTHMLRPPGSRSASSPPSSASER